MIDLLDIGNHAHVEVEAVDENGLRATSEPKFRILNVADFKGDYTATLHVGESDYVLIGSSASSHVTFNVVLYEVSLLDQGRNLINQMTI